MKIILLLFLCFACTDTTYQEAIVEKKIYNPTNPKLQIKINNKLFYTGDYDCNIAVWSKADKGTKILVRYVDTRYICVGVIE